MGACLSKKGLPAHTSENKNKPRLSKQKQPLPAVDRGTAPPPLPPSPPEEEAVVKEVLTEIPSSAIVAAVYPSSHSAEVDAKLVKPPRKVDVNGRRSEGEEGGSEICSASESFSVSTTTLTEKRDVGSEDLDEQTSALRKGPSAKGRPPERSPNAWKTYHQRPARSSHYSPGELPCSRRRGPKGDVGGGGGGGGGGGRSSPSPAKKSSDRRSVPGWDASSNMARQRAGNGNAAAAGAAGRGRGGERSGTRGRSASPAAKRAAACGGGGRGGGVVNRRWTMRRMTGTGRGSPEQTPRREEDECRQMVMIGRSGGAEEGEQEREEGGEGGMLPAPVSEETLENPLVSLECFIFL